MSNHTYRRLRVGNIQPNSYQQPGGGYFMSIELRYHPLIPNRTCQRWDCPRFSDVTFEDIRITGAARAGDIAGFDGDLLEKLTFKNVTFVNPPPRSWSCGYVDTSSFVATGVTPPLQCSNGPRESQDSLPISVNPSRYSTDFGDEQRVLSAWTPEEGCAHCSGEAEGGKDECTNMTAAALAFGDDGMTITTRALGSAAPTACHTERPVCASGHLSWNPTVRFGNFSVVARWFPSEAGGVRTTAETATGFIGLDAPGNEASITMGFHADGWLGGHGEGSHRYQHGIYADVAKSHNRQYTTTTPDISDGFHTYGLLWTPSAVEWSFDGALVRRVSDASIIPQVGMQLRLHTRSGYCDKMDPSASFRAMFRSFSYAPVDDAFDNLPDVPVLRRVVA